MRSIQTIGIVNVLFGIAWLFIPIKFYSISMKLFTSDVSPPFGVGTIMLIAFLLFLPAVALVLNGIAWVVLGDKMERVPEIKVFTESGEYMGRLKGAEVEEGEVEKFEVGEQVLDKDEVLAVDDVLLVKEKEGFKGPAAKHEFIGKEVYTKRGIYLGKVEAVNLDQSEKSLEFTAVKGTKREVFTREDIVTSNDVIIVKSLKA